MSNIFSLLKHSWNNTYKEKYFWLFVVLILVGPAFKLVLTSVQLDTWLSSFLELAQQLAYLLFLIAGQIGIIFVVFSIATKAPISLSGVFQVIKKSFGKTAILFLFLSFLFLPFICLVAALSFRNANQTFFALDNLYFFTSLTFIFNSIVYFSLAEIVINNSGVRKSLLTAWKLFLENFIFLLIVGFVLTSVSLTMGILIGALAQLIEFNFDFAVLSELNLISPYLSFAGNQFYGFSFTIGQTIWSCYSISVFTFAYLKLSKVKIENLYTDVL